MTTTLDSAPRARGREEPMRSRLPRLRQDRRRRVAAYGFLAPFMLLFAGLFFFPIGYALYTSLYRQTFDGLGFGGSELKFVGLSSYVTVFTTPDFYNGVFRLLQFGVIVVPLILGVAILLALILDSRLAFMKRLFRAAFVLPYTVPGVIAALLWGFLYQPGLSPITSATQSMGLGSVDLVGSDLVLGSIGNIMVWAGVGFNMLIIYAALQSIPSSIVEAARVDGAGEIRIALRIKLPIVMPAVVMTGLFTIIGTLQLFNEPVILSKISNAISSNYTPNMMAYNAAYGNNDEPLSAAISVSLALIAFVMSFGFLRLTARASGLSAPKETS
ncbi:carbohydrate ABC transporter permease [Streptomyces sp. SP18BB07]|uniref:carbohydrate ABC transporter permease n=1 Tax=Streptomyces sp. SP18BB07 TaxID=3002522 RepID=UPI002E76DBA1|nr:sugar ABC transporter permease [Streptomyces sp. SP18BB07]MEE1765115.1 sugar ABC transporter permease [Streptomyces sp. SP18BB07]